MSHAGGQVKFLDGTILYYEYNGTCDVVCNCLYRTHEEMNDNWREQPDNTCNCGNDETVEIATCYGNGFFWEGRACKKCMAITDGLGFGMEDYRERIDGLPEWWV